MTAALDMANVVCMTDGEAESCDRLHKYLHYVSLTNINVAITEKCTLGHIII